MYIATLGYVLACYAISETLLGSGALSVLAFGVILGNYTQVLDLLRMKQPSASFSKVTEYLTRFQTELSFILRAFFFVLLGIVFEVSISSIVVGLSLGLPIVAILLGARYIAVSASTWKSPMVSEKKIIVGLCAQGLTPALLSFIVLQYNFPNAYLFPLIVTYVIIMTNIIASVASFMYKRTKSHDQATVSIALGNEPVPDSKL
jgi:cell volume regulation protein A